MYMWVGPFFDLKYPLLDPVKALTLLFFLDLTPDYFIGKVLSKVFIKRLDPADIRWLGREMLPLMLGLTKLT